MVFHDPSPQEEINAMPSRSTGEETWKKRQLDGIVSWQRELRSSSNRDEELLHLRYLQVMHFCIGNLVGSAVYAVGFRKSCCFWLTAPSCIHEDILWTCAALPYKVKFEMDAKFWEISEYHQPFPSHVLPCHSEMRMAVVRSSRVRVGSFRT